MISRNEKREIFMNDHKMYESLMEKRGLSSINHYGRYNISEIGVEEIKQLEIIDHMWRTGDSLYKLSHKYYGSVKYWWIIGWFNKKPTDVMYKTGTLVHIPTPLEEILYYVDRDG
jgi:hypothetical protein